MWLYVPPISSVFAPEAPGSISESSWQCRTLARSVWWRGRRSPSRIWSQRCSKVSWLRLLSGAMSPPSTAGRGVASWMASLAESRASLTVSPASGSPKTMSATSGPTQGASSFSPARGSSSSKTSRECSRRAARSASGVTWDGLVSSVRLDFSRREASARRISATARSSSVWPTPAARDCKGANSADHLDNGTGRKHLDQLPNFVEHLWSSPSVADTSVSFHQVHPTYQAGETSSHPRRNLNPLFVEWLMGWPPGWTLLAWTDFACSATALSAWKARMRSALLQLGLPVEAAPVQRDLFA